MTVSLKLSSALYSCPTNWVRFIEDLRNRRVKQTVSEGFDIATLNQELARFKAHYIPATRVDFEDERCYTLFVLKYGGE